MLDAIPIQNFQQGAGAVHLHPLKFPIRPGA
jgi:hypothetical protein